MIYLDNAATTFLKPPEVYQKVLETMVSFSANPGRSGHKTALNAARIVLNARESICDFFGGSDCSDFVFTLNCTDALNIAIKGILSDGGHAVATVYEHNSVLRPLEYLKQYRRADYTIVSPNPEGIISPVQIEKALRPDTRLVIVNYVSNVTGTVQDINGIGDVCRRHNVPLLVDAAQAAGSIPINVSAMPIDLLCCAGHKGLYGPQGVGVLYVRPGIKVQPLRHGGTGSHSSSLEQPVEMPDYLESGTCATPAIAGLAAGVKAVSGRTEQIAWYEQKLAARLSDGLRNIKGITVYSLQKPKSGVISFNIEDTESATVAELLDEKYDIACRGGLHCAPLIHQYLGTQEIGAVRFSIGMYNTPSEIDQALHAVNEIVKMSE